MSPSHKSQWQKALAKSGLGHRAIGTGVVMSLYADADGTRMHPSMRTLAKDMGCDKKYVTEGRSTLREYGWIVFVAKGVRGQKGDEFMPTFGQCHRSLSGTPETVAIGPSQEAHRSVLEAHRSVLEAPEVPERVTTMRSTMYLNHEEHHEPTGSHECTGVGEHAWCKVEAEAATAAEELMASAPGFD